MPASARRRVDGGLSEELRRAWLDAGDLAEQRRIAAKLQMQVWQDVPFIPMGESWQATAYRKGLTGIIGARCRGIPGEFFRGRPHSNPGRVFRLNAKKR
jgi:hypothetical protein